MTAADTDCPAGFAKLHSCSCVGRHWSTLVDSVQGASYFYLHLILAYYSYRCCFSLARSVFVVPFFVNAAKALWLWPFLPAYATCSGMLFFTILLSWVPLPHLGVLSFFSHLFYRTASSKNGQRTAQPLLYHARQKSSRRTSRFSLLLQRACRTTAKGKEILCQPG